MITFKAIIIPGNKRKDGTYPVKIRVTFKGVSRRLPTTLVCTQSDLTRTLHIKSPDILNKSDALIAKMRDAIKDISPFDLDIRDVDWVVSHIKSSLTSSSFRLDFFEWADMFLLTKKEGNKAGYVSALNAFERFLDCRAIDINSITKSMIMDFMEFVDNEPKMSYSPRTKEYKITDISKSSGASSARYVHSLAHIYNSARDKYNDEDEGKVLIPKSPFSKIAIKKAAPAGQKNIGRELMQTIISYQTDDEIMRIGLDMFIISFCLMGANMVDLYKAKSFRGDWWIYNRSKTTERRADKAEMRVLVPPEAAPYLERMKGHHGHWLRLSELFEDKDYATETINRYLKKWCKVMDIEPFTFYAARHTWASLGRSIGIEKATIDDCLVHRGDYSITDIYAEKSWDLMQEANRKVLDLFEW